MKKILLINGCVNREQSRTYKLAKAYLNKLREAQEIEITELILEEEQIPILNTKMLEKRNKLSEEGRFLDSMFDYAREFAQADEIVLAAPYWDMSFPAMVKNYIEKVCVGGITFRYTEEGAIEGMCRADKLVYLTTSGGPIGEYNLGYQYITSLCRICFGIEQCEFISAEGLNIVGNSADRIMEEAIAKL